MYLVLWVNINCACNYVDMCGVIVVGRCVKNGMKPRDVDGVGVIRNKPSRKMTVRIPNVLWNKLLVARDKFPVNISVNTLICQVLDQYLVSSLRKNLCI